MCDPKKIGGGQRKMRGRQRQKIRVVVWQLVAFKEAVPPPPPSAGRGVEGGGADILFFSFSLNFSTNQISQVW